MFGESIIQGVMDAHGVTRQGAEKIVRQTFQRATDTLRAGGRLLMLTPEETAQMEMCVHTGEEIPSELEAKLINPENDLIRTVIAEVQASRS